MHISIKAPTDTADA